MKILIKTKPVESFNFEIDSEKLELSDEELKDIPALKAYIELYYIPEHFIEVDNISFTN